MEVSHIENMPKYRKELRSFMNQIMVSAASVYKSKEESNKFMEGLALVSNNVHYQIMPEQAAEQYRYYVAANMQNHEAVLHFFNLQSSNKLIKEGAKIILDSIKTNMRIYVPMLAPPFTMEESYTYDDMNEEMFEHLRLERQETIRNEYTGYHTKENLHNPNTHVKIRILHNKLVQRSTPQKFEQAVIHFHGGGFCCQDSSAHQNYTRKWAIELGIPVFSVDYRLAPKNPYPDPVNDCYQAYVWIVT